MIGTYPRDCGAWHLWSECREGVLDDLFRARRAGSGKLAQSQRCLLIKEKSRLYHSQNSTPLGPVESITRLEQRGLNLDFHLLLL